MKNLILLLLVIAPPALADTTSGGVNWLDTAVYQKPAFYPITYGPVEATSAHKYWVNLSGGSGSTCTQATPCSWSTVQGKPGTHGDGGGAFIYIEGSGGIGSPVLYGTAGNEIIVKPWGTGSPQATITGRNNWTTQIQYVIFDGGPNLQIEFLETTNNQFDPVIYLNATAGLEDHITFYRTYWYVGGTGDWMDAYGIFTNLYYINSEFSALGATDTSNQHHIYFSLDSQYGPSSNWYIYNNIFRDTPGEAFELRLFDNISGFYAFGNAMHDIGKLTCSSSWGCRQAFDFSAAGNGSQVLTGTVANNLIFDIGGECINSDGITNSVLIANNTCYLWGNGPTNHGNYSKAAMSDNGSFNYADGIYTNNAIVSIGSAAGGIGQRIAFPPGSSMSHMSYNACTSAGTPCNASGGVTLNASGTDLYTVAVTGGGSSGSSAAALPGSLNFLTPVTTGGLCGEGTNLYSSGITTDYLGLPRPSSGAFTIGAFQNCVDSSLTPPPNSTVEVPLPPSNLTVH